MTARQFLTNAIFLAIIAFLIGVVFIILSYNADRTTNFTSGLLRDFGILFGSVGVVSVLYETLIRRNLLNQYNDVLREIVDPDSRRLGIVALFHDRTVSREYDPDYFIRHARRSIDILGIGLYTFVPEHQQRLLDKLREGCRLRCLIFDNQSPHAQMLEKSLGQNGQLLGFMGSQRNYFTAFIEEAKRQKLAEALEVRLYDLVPAWGLIAIDRDIPDGLMKIEVYGTKIEGSQCPGFVVANEYDGWYRFFSDQFQTIWDTAKPLV